MAVVKKEKRLSAIKKYSLKIILWLENHSRRSERPHCYFLVLYWRKILELTVIINTRKRSERDS